MNRWLQVRAERVAQFAREFNFPGRCPWLTFRGHPLRIVDVLPAEVLLMRPCGRLILFPTSSIRKAAAAGYLRTAKEAQAEARAARRGGVVPRPPEQSVSK